MSSTLRFPLALALLGLGFACVAPVASGIVLDWDSATWTAGALSQSYDIDPAKTGTDVTLTIGGSTGELAGDRVNNQPTPQVNTNLHGGQNPVQNGLNVAMDLGRKDRSISVTISFSSLYVNGVSNVSFSIFGIDQAAGGSNLYIDEIRSISALLADGTSAAASITNVGSAVSLSGTGLAQTLTGIANVPTTGAGSGAGNATISFNTDGIRSITLVFGAGGNSAVNPLFQEISISDLTYSPVPEMNPTAITAALCLAAVAVHWRRVRPRRD